MPHDFSEDDFGGTPAGLTFDESDFEAQQPAPLSGPEKVLGYLQKNVAPAIEGIARLPYLPYELLNKGVTAAEVGMGMKPEAAGLPDLKASIFPKGSVRNILYGGMPGAVLPPEGAPGELEKGAEDFLSESIEGIATPENIIPVGLAAKAPLALRPAIQRGVGRMFQAQTAAAVPASLEAIQQAETPSDVVKQTLGAGANIFTPLAIQRGMLPRARLAAIAEAQRGAAANASQVGETAPVHGDVRPQPQPSAGEVPPEVSGPGVQPQAKPAQTPEAQQPRVLLKTEVGQQLQAGIETLKDETEFSNFSRRIMEAQRAKVISAMEASALRRQLRQQRGAAALPILTPEENGLVDAERQAIDTPIDVIDATQPGENEPFARARAGQIAGIDRANGRIWINGHEFGDWLQSDVPPERRAQAVRSVLGQERNHLATSAADAERYAGTLTAAELAIERRIYTQRWGGRPDVSNTDLGFEAIRRRMDRLARMDTQEVIQAVGKERWKLKTLEALNDTIRRIRENLGTKASKEGLAILDRVQQNLDAGIVAAGGQPAAVRPEQEAERIAAMTPADFAQWAKDSGRGATGAGYDFAKRMGEQGRATLERYAKQQNEEMGQLHAKIHATPKEDRLPMFAESAQRAARKQFFDEGIRLLDAAKSVADGMPPEMAADAHGVSVEDVREISAQKQPEPAALRPKKGKEQPELYLPPSVEQNVPHENVQQVSKAAPAGGKPAILPEVPRGAGGAIPSKQNLNQPGLPLRPVSGVGEERPSATELGAQPFTATELDRAGYSHLENATDQALSQTEAGKAPKPPSFQAYKTALQHQFGDLQPGQLYESYSRNLYKRLLNASGPHLEAMARSLGINARNVAEPARARQPGLALETEGASREAKAQIRSEQASAASRQRYRNGLVSRIADKLLKEAAPDTVATPKAVSPEDVRSPGDSKEPSFWDVAAHDLDTPNVLAQRLTQDARRSGKDPVSLTKRLTALLDKQTGRVYLVSTYPHGRAGAMLLDPSVSTLRNHRPLPDILKRFRPVSSILLDQPVKNFRQGFESLGDFESKFATDARRASQQSFPEPLSEGEQAETGSWERGEPITDAEAGAILDHVTSEVGRFEEVDDVKASLSALREDTNPQVLSAYRKLSEQLLRQNPDLSNEGLINQLAQNIYDTHKAAPDYETFVKRTMAQGGATYQPPAEVGPEPQPSETSKELTMPIERRPPTDVRPENIPPEEAAKLGTKPAPPVPQGRPDRVTSEPGALRPKRKTETQDRALSITLNQQAAQLGRQPPMRQRSLAELSTQPLYHETSLKNAYEVYRRLKKSFDHSWLRFFASNNIDLALGQSGKGVTFEIDPSRVNGWENRKPGTTEAAGREFSIDKSISSAADAIIFSNPRQMEAFKKRYPNSLDYSGSSEVDRGIVGGKGIRVPTRIHELDKVREGESPAALRPLKDIADEVRAQGRPEKVTSEPASLRPIKDEVERVRDMAKLLATRSSMVNDIARSMDDVDNSKNNLSRQAETRIRYASSREKATRLEKLTGFYKGNTQVLSAANAMVEAQFSRFRLPEFLAQLDQAKQNAQQMLQSQSWRERRIGKAYLRDIDASEKEVRYAQAHWNDPELQDTARKVRRSLDDQYNLEKAKGFDLTKEPGYVPHRLLGIWGGAETLFQLPRVLGTKYRLPRTFDTHYEALAAGPYMRVTHDIASLVGHRVRQGLGNIFRHEWKEGLKSIQFPDGTPMALEPIQGSKGPQSPNPAYKLIDTGGLGSIAVHEDIYKPIRGLLAPDYFDNAPVPRNLLHAEQMLKHALLIGDFFHLFKMGYFGSSIIGKEVLRGGRAGWSVLDIAERDIPEAVKKGIVRPEDATWAAEQVDFGNTKISRRQLVEKFYRQMGANLGKVQDALYKDLITDLTPTAGPIRRGIARLADPSIGRYNRFLFDRFTRGLMSESVAREFERQQKAKPEADPAALMRDIAKDVNVFYGNIGRQGWFKSKTAQNLARLVGLAPQWVEGLVKKEATAYSRVSGLSSLTGQRQGVTTLGTTGRAMGRAMVFMFGLTQAINLITRGKPTWQNEEEGHKLDAWIPAIGSDKEGFWMSPMAIFNEVTHDLYRIGEAKMVQGQPMMDTVTQVLSNKESPIARGLIVMGTGRSPTGEKITSSMGRVAEAGKAMAPLPITFGRYAQAAGHALAPSVIPSVPPGQMQRQAFGTAGVKIEPALGAPGEMRRTASEFMRREGLKKETGWEQIQTDEPSYTKLRTAIRANDDARAAKLLNELRKGRTDGEIIKAMKKHSISPFTGNTKAERLFLGSLDDRGLGRYSQAREQLMGDFQSFAEWYLRQPERKQ
jgi:hypothetical protein